MAVNHIFALYQGEQARIYWQRQLNLDSPVAWKIARLRAGKLQPYISSEMRVLEYGVGPGYNLAALSCALKVGYDVCDQFGKDLPRHGIVFCREVDGLPDASFDVIICHHVLEHTVEPWATLETLRRLLRPEGVLLLFVPYEYERRYRHYVSGEKNHHVYSWNPQTLGALVSNAGFEIESLKLKMFAYDRFVAAVAERLGLGDRFCRFFRKMLLLIRPGYEIRAVLRKH